MSSKRINARVAVPIAATFVFCAIICANVVPAVHAAPEVLRDQCGHTLTRPSSFLDRHFDWPFLKKFFKHWIPFTSRARVKMHFYLYKRDFRECGREIRIDEADTLECSGFNPDHPTRIIIHGWMSQSKGSLNRAVKNAYLSLTSPPARTDPTTEEHYGDGAAETEAQVETVPATDNESTTTADANVNSDNNINNNEINNNNNYYYYTNNTYYNNNTDYNVIVVDWSFISSNVNYFGVVELIEDLGFLLSEFVRYLHLQTGLHYDDIYLIGHSLGAQIAGSAGKQSQPYRFNTIFALDPAGPQFRERSDEYRIDPTDAEYVECIQTSNSLGFQEPVGHATFYPNYGRDQKKCYIYGCSHTRAHHYFAESITSKQGFWGTLCRRQSEDVWILSSSGAEFRMGGEPSTPKRGTFYVKTNGKPPYALGRGSAKKAEITIQAKKEIEKDLVLIA